MRATSMFWSSAIVIVIIATLVYAIYKIRRAAEEQRRRSDERAATMMLALQEEPAQPTATTASGTALPAPKPRTTITAAPPELRRRARILTDTQRSLYLALRAAMPDHPMMANLRIVDLLDVTDSGVSIEREPRLRELLRERLDFVVCDGDLVPLAGLVIYESGITNVPDESGKIGALREMGIRFVRLRADGLPTPAELRSLVLS